MAEKKVVLSKGKGEIRDFYTDPDRYDLVMGPVGVGEFVAFYRRQVSRYGEPVLELGCGSGRLLIPLAEDGTTITGVDLAPSMLDLAQKKAATRSLQISTVVGDVRSLDLGTTFKLILFPANSMMHLLTRDDVESCLAAVLRHLAADGRFVIEVWNPSLAMLTAPPGTRSPVGEYTDGKTGGNIVVTSEARYDAATQVNQITYHYRQEPEGREVALTFKMRQFFPQELDMLLAHAGFVIEEKYGDRDETKFTSASARQIVVCRTSSGSIRPKRDSKRPK